MRNDTNAQLDKAGASIEKLRQSAFAAAVRDQSNRALVSLACFHLFPEKPMSHTEVILKEGGRVCLTVPPGCVLVNTGATPSSSEYTVERVTAGEVNAIVARAVRAGDIPHDIQCEIIRAVLVAAQDALRPSVTALSQNGDSKDPAQAAEKVARAGVRAWQTVSGL